MPQIRRRDFRFLRMLAKDVGRPIAPAPHRPRPEEWNDGAVTGAWLGHSTVLMNFRGLWAIADPVLAAKCGVRLGPLVIGPKRYVAPALTVKELPEIDLVLLTHAHMDHLDRWTLRRLRGRPVAVTAHRTGDLLRGLPFSQVKELAWDESAEIETRHGSVAITARRVAHWGARMRHDEWRGYCGCVLERAGVRIGFAGDTARTDFSHWRDGGALDLLAMPIGAYNPWIHAHCNPEEAVAMANEAGARRVLPIHHSTFKLSAEPLEEPIWRFREALRDEPGRIAAVEIGETFRIQ